MKMKDIIKKIIMQEKLIEKEPTLNSIGLYKKTNVNNIYLGTGLGNHQEMSIGFPIDLLSMILTAEKIRRITGGEIYHNIADNHALTNDFDFEKIKILSEKNLNDLTRITKNLNLEKYNIFQSSKFHRSNEYNQILSGINIKEHAYVQKELADIEFFRQVHNTNIKIGWAIKGKDKTNYDEVFFDNIYTKTFGNQIISIYTTLGKRLEDRRPNAAPYILLENDLEKRIHFQQEKNTKEIIQDSNCNTTTKNIFKNYLKGLVRLYEQVIEPLNGSVEKKTDQIILKVRGL
jgi:hypothetical protein